jgi:hypothetical protein
MEYLGIWEKVYNPTFNYVEFDIIKSKAGLNNFRISVKELIKTNIMQQAIEEIKMQYPDEWLVLGNPVMDSYGQQALAGEVICHGGDKREVARRAHQLVEQYDSTIAFFNKTTVGSTRAVLASIRPLQPINQ